MEAGGFLPVPVPSIKALCAARWAPRAPFAPNRHTKSAIGIGYVVWRPVIRPRPRTPTARPRCVDALPRQPSRRATGGSRRGAGDVSASCTGQSPGCSSNVEQPTRPACREWLRQQRSARAQLTDPTVPPLLRGAPLAPDSHMPPCWRTPQPLIYGTGTGETVRGSARVGSVDHGAGSVRGLFRVWRESLRAGG